MLRPIAAALLLLAGLAWSGTATAWGPLGHRLVATLAWEQVNPQARAQVERLLAGADHPSLAGIANWADWLRGDDTRLARRSARWHYVNLAADGCQYVARRDCPGGNCVVGAINRQLAILGDRQRSRPARRRALKFVVHLVADVHQPLHAGYARDRGGNTFQVNLDGDGSNLHQLWDSGLLRASGRGADEYLRWLRAYPPETGLDPNPVHWAEGSCRIVVRPGFYPPRSKISHAYLARWRPMAEAQLRRAAAHLALVLNRALAGSR